MDKTVWSELEKHGVLLEPCNKEELSNIVLVNSLFMNKKLYITRNCVNGIREIKNWKWKRLKLGAERNLPEEVTDLDNHFCDQLDYLAGYCYGSKSPNPEVSKYKESIVFKTIQDTKRLRQESQS